MYKVKVNTVTTVVENGNRVEKPVEIEVELIEPTRIAAGHSKFCMAVAEYGMYEQALVTMAMSESESERKAAERDVRFIRARGNRFVEDKSSMYEEFVNIFVVSPDHKTTLVRDLYAAEELMNHEEVRARFGSFFGNTPAGLRAAEELKKVASAKKNTDKTES